MRNLHSNLLQQAVSDAGPWAHLLRGAPILITGASGFLAGSLLSFLTRLNEVYSLELKLFATARRPQGDLALLKYLEIDYRGEWDVSPVETTKLPATDGLIVVHTASYGSPKDYVAKAIETFDANTEGIKHLYREAMRTNAARIVYFSSAEIYGQPPDSAIPTPEDFVGGLTTMDPRSIYGESKRMAEVLGVCLAKSSGIPFTCIRPWNIYGPGQRPDDGRVPIEFIRQAITYHEISLSSDGSPRRSFCFAWDGIYQIARLLATDASGRAWNVGNGFDEVSILGLAKACSESSGNAEDSVRWDPTACAPGMKRSAPDVRCVQSLEGMRQSFTPLSTGLSTVLDWVTWHKLNYEA